MVLLLFVFFGLVYSMEEFPKPIIPELEDLRANFTVLQAEVTLLKQQVQTLMNVKRKEIK